MSSLSGKKILCRADSSPLIGTGHIRRIEVLASELRKNGAEITFAARQCQDVEGADLITFLSKKGYVVNIMPTAKILFDPNDYTTWLGKSVSEDIDETFQDSTYDLCIIDHYGITSTWHNAARKYSSKLLAMDDEGKADLSVNILVNQNYYTDIKERYFNAAGDDTTYLLGPDYAFLRDEFIEARDKVSLRTNLNTLLVMLGGADPQNITRQIIEGLDVDPNVKVIVVVGQAYGGKRRDELESLTHSKGFELYFNTDKIADLMARADFAIGAGGTSSWERCCMKLPAATFSLATNQIEISSHLATTGAVIDLGSSDKFESDKLNEHITMLKNQPELIKNMSNCASHICDGLGKNHIVEKIYSLIK